MPILSRPCRVFIHHTELLGKCIREILRPFPSASALFEQYFQEDDEGKTHPFPAEAQVAQEETLDESMSLEQVLSSFDGECAEALPGVWA